MRLRGSIHDYNGDSSNVIPDTDCTAVIFRVCVFVCLFVCFVVVIWLVSFAVVVVADFLIMKETVISEVVS